MLDRMFLHHSSMYNMRCMYSLELIVVIELDVRPLGVTKISPSFFFLLPHRLRGLGAYLAVGNHVLFTERQNYSLSGTQTQLSRRHNNPDGHVYLPIYEQRR